MPVILLTEYEIALAAIVAAQRHAQNLALERHERYGAEKRGGGLSSNFHGCQGEVAAAKFLDVFWSGAVGNLRARDNSKVQVRATPRPNGGLILHPDDKDEEIFFLARLDGPRVDLRGWVRAKYGKQQCYWQPDDRARNWTEAFCVPERALHRFKVDAPPATAPKLLTVK